MERNLIKLAVCLVAFLNVAFCGSIETDVGGTISGVVGTPALNAACNQQSLTGATLSLSNCAVYSRINPANGQPESFTIVGSTAAAAYNSIGTSSSISLVNADLSAGTLAESGYGRVIDDLVTQLPATAAVALVFNLNGSVGPEVGLDFSRLVLSFGFNYPNLPFPAYQFITTGNNFSGQIVTPAYAVSLYQSYSYFFSLSSQNIQTNPKTSTSYNASGNVDFSHTLSIAGVGAWDANGNLLANAVIGSANNSGNFTILNVQEIVAAPEPGTTLTFLAGIGALIVAAKRLRQSKSRSPAA